MLTAFFLCGRYFYVNISSTWEIITFYGNTEPIALCIVSDSLLWWILKSSTFSKGHAEKSWAYFSFIYKLNMIQVYLSSQQTASVFAYGISIEQSII